MDWKILQRISLAVFVVAIVVLLGPAALCVKRISGGLEIGGGSFDVGSDEYAAAARANLEQVGSATGFVGRFFGAVPQCVGSNSPLRQPLPVQGAAGGGLLAFVVFTLLARGSYRRQVRSASRRQTAARQVVETRQVSSVRTGASTTSSRPVAGSGQSVAARGGATTASSALAPPQVGRVDALDVLSALDAEAAQGEWRRDPSGMQPSASPQTSTARPAAQAPRAPTAAAAIPEPAASPSGAGGPIDDFGGETMASVPGLSASAQPPASPSVPSTPTTFSSPSAADRWGSWDDDAELTELLSGVPTPSGAYDAARPGGQVAAPGGTRGGASAPSRSAFAVAGPAAGARDATQLLAGTIRVMRIPQRWILGEDLEIAIALQEYDAYTLSRVCVTLSLVGTAGTIEEIWPTAVRLNELLETEEIERIGRGRVKVPWAAIAAGLTGRHDRVGGGAKLRVSVTLDSQEAVGSANVEDRITVQFVDSHGLPLRPTVARILREDLSSVRAGIGAVQAGVLDSGWMTPGRYSLEFEDGTELRTRDGRISPKVGIETDGLAALRAGVPVGAVRRLQAVAPDLIWVDPAAAATGDGSEGRPYQTVAEALSTITSRLPGSPPVEIRVSPSGGRPIDREGVLPGVGAQNFAAWWEGRAYTTGVSWMRPASASAHRAELRLPAVALREDIRFEQIEGIRLVNAGFARLRERAALDADLLARLDSAYAAEPLVVSLAPAGRTQDPFRLEIIACIGVRIEGIRWIGCSGQSGITISDSAGVNLTRCWIEGFESGATGRAGVHAVGRGLQVGHTGTDDDPVEVTWCAIGWNRAVRPSVPIRGAAMSAFESTVRMSRCLIHDNVANLDPPDVAVDRKGRLLGDGTNVRSGNAVEK